MNFIKVLLFLAVSLFFGLFAGSTKAQEQAPDVQTAVKEKIRSKNWSLVMNLSRDTWQNVPAAIELKAWSPGFSFLTLRSYALAGEQFRIGWGYGISSHNVHHNGYFTKNSEGDMELLAIPDSVGYSKNKLNATYADLSIEFQLVTRMEKRPFHMAFGAKGGYLLGFRSKFKDSEGVVKTPGPKGASQFNYGLTARMGFSNIGVMVWYGLSPLFEDTGDVELIPFSVGVYIRVGGA